MPARRQGGNARSARARQTRTSGESSSIETPTIPSLSNEALNLALSARNLTTTGDRSAREARLAAAVSLPGSSGSSTDPSPPADRSAPRSTNDPTTGGVPDDRQVDNSSPDSSQRVSPQPGPIPAATRVNPHPPPDDDDAAVIYYRPPKKASSAVRLCAHISDAILAKIHRGEYVGFQYLLKSQDNTSAPKRLRITEDASDPNCFSLAVQQGSSGRQVIDQDSWLEAWTIYVAATLSAAPERALELVGYQAIILDAMRRFPAVAVIRYDVAFRQLAARDATMQWDQRDLELYADLLTAATQRPRMDNPRQPFRQPFRQPLPATADGTKICLGFNSITGCDLFNCRYAHACSACGGPHSKPACKPKSH